MNLEQAERELRESIAAAPRRILCVDLDGCLAEYDHWRGYLQIGKPRKHVVDLVRAEYKDGAFIIIHTVRVTSKSHTVIPRALAALEKWLSANRIPYNEIWLGTGKPYASLYLDDKAHNIDCMECTKRWYSRRISVNERKRINVEKH